MYSVQYCMTAKPYGPKLAAVGCVVLVFLASGGLWLAYRGSHHIKLTREDLQRAVEKKFPIEKKELLYSASLSDPTVELTEGSDRIGLSLKAQASALGSKPVHGTVDIDGGVDYDPNAGELFLVDPSVKKLDIEGLDGHTAEVAHEALNALLTAKFNRVLLYRLNPDRPNERQAHDAVKSVVVKGGRVVIELK